MLISDKLKSFDFTYAEKEIVKYFLNQKEEIARQSTRIRFSILIKGSKTSKAHS